MHTQTTTKKKIVKSKHQNSVDCPRFVNIYIFKRKRFFFLLSNCCLWHMFDKTKLNLVMQEGVRTQNHRTSFIWNFIGFLKTINRWNTTILIPNDQWSMLIDLRCGKSSLFFLLQKAISIRWSHVTHAS